MTGTLQQVRGSRTIAHLYRSSGHHRERGDWRGLTATQGTGVTQQGTTQTFAYQWTVDGVVVAGEPLIRTPQRVSAVSA